MFQDGLDDLPVFDETNDSHDSPTLRASQGVDLVNLLNQPGPVLSVFLRALIHFQVEDSTLRDAGDPVVFRFFSLSPGDITVVSIIPYSRHRRDSPLSGMWEHMAVHPVK